MVESSSISITPSQHADRHVVGGNDPLIDPITTTAHTTSHQRGGSDELGTIYNMTDDILFSNDALKSMVAGSVWTKLKEMKLEGMNGTLRIVYDILCTPAGSLESRVRRNGAEVGVQNVNTGTYSQDIAGWETGDLCQIYVYCVAGETADVSNMRVLGELITVKATNQDP